MVTLGDHNEVMQVTEIAVVVRKQNAILLNGVAEMNWVVVAAQSGIRRHLDFVSCLRQQSSEERAGRIVVEIEPHERLSRDISWGESTRGVAWNL
jgi:hypothetical protein